MEKCRDIFVYIVLYGEYSGLDLILLYCIVYVLCKEYELRKCFVDMKKIDQEDVF